MKRVSIQCLKLGCELIALSVAAIAVAAGLLVWRLSSEPVQLDFLNERLVAALNPETSPVRVEPGDMSLRWDSERNEIALEARRLDIRKRSDGQLIAHIPVLSLNVNLLASLQGSLRFEEARITAPMLIIERDAQGQYVWSATALPREALAEEIVPANGDVIKGGSLRQLAPRITRDLLPFFDRLDALLIEEAFISLRDKVTGSSAGITFSEVSLNQANNVVFVRASAAASIPTTDQLEAGRHVTAHLSMAMGDGGELITGQLRFSGLQWAMVEKVGTLFGPRFERSLNNVEAELPADSEARGLFEWEWRADSGLAHALVSGDLSIGGGILPVSGAQIPLETVSFNADYWPGRMPLMQADGQARLAGQQVTASVDLTEAEPGRHRLDARLNVDQVELSTAFQSWPGEIAPQTRAWLETNLLRGQVTDLTIEADASVEPGGRINLGRLEGQFDFTEAAVQYLSALPPGEDLAGSGRFDRERLEIAVVSGAIDTVVLKPSGMIFSDLGKVSAEARIEANGTGPFRDIMEALNHPRFGYADELGLDVAALAGTADAAVRLDFPVRPDLNPEEISIAVAGQLTDGIVGPFFGDTMLYGANLAIEIDLQGMTATGPLTVRGMPMDVQWQQSFDPAVPIRTEVTFGMPLSPDGLSALGAGTGDLVSGEGKLTGTVEQLRDGTVSLAVRGDLTGVGISLPAAGVSKSAADEGELVARVTIPPQIPGNPRAVIDQLLLTAPGIMIEGSGRSMGPDTADLRLSRADFAGHRLTASASQRPGVPLILNIGGELLDLAPILERRRTEAERETPQGQAKEGPYDGAPAMQVTLSVDRMRLDADARPLEAVRGQFELGSGFEPETWRLDASAGQNLIALGVADNEAGQRRFFADIHDLGGFLGSAGISSPVSGGHLIASFDLAPRDVPLAGEHAQPIGFKGDVRLSDFALLDAPVVARSLNVLSEQGLEAVQPDAGLEFSQFTALMEKDGEMIRIIDGKARGAQLGFTLQGTHDLETGHLDLNGTLVPVYTLNRFIGAIPILGTILTGGDGEGMFAANFSLSGPVEDLDLSVNPLSALAPGIIRKILFDQRDGSEEEGQERRFDLDTLTHDSLDGRS